VATSAVPAPATRAARAVTDFCSFLRRNSDLPRVCPAASRPGMQRRFRGVRCAHRARAGAARLRTSRTAGLEDSADRPVGDPPPADLCSGR
jgi:hypothetical protein